MSTKSASIIEQPPSRSDSRSFWLDFALVMLVCFVAGGAPAPHVNETHYLLKAKHYWDPSFCPGDLFLDSADAHLPFYWTVGWLTAVMPLTGAAWVGRIAAWALISWGWVKLVRTVTRAPWAAPLSALVWLVLVDRFDFAGEWVVGGMPGKGGVEGKCFAYGFVLFGLAAMAAGRWTAPWIWFGAAAAMHVLVGGWAVLAGLGAWLFEPRASRPPFVKLLPGVAIGGALALPGLWPAWALDRNASTADGHEAARIYVYERLPHHLAPHTLAPDDFRGRVVRFGLLVAGFAALAARISTRSRHAAAAPEVWNPAAWNRAALSRITRFATVALVGNCVGMAIELGLADRPLVAAPLLRFYWYRLADVIVPLAVALAATCLAAEVLGSDAPLAADANAGSSTRVSSGGPLWARLAVGLAVLACTGYLVQIAVDRLRNPAPPGVARMDDVGAWLAACDWIREHAPPEALCLVPRHAQSFKWYAQRADVVNWKDVPQDAAGVIEWRRRIHDVFRTVEGPDGPEVLSSPEQWGAARALAVARRYGATFIVARAEPPLGLNEAFAAKSDAESAGYAVYRVDASGTSSDAPESEGP